MILQEFGFHHLVFFCVPKGKRTLLVIYVDVITITRHKVNHFTFATMLLFKFS